MKTNVENKKLIAHVMDIYHRKGARYLVYLCSLQFKLLYFKIVNSRRTFTSGGKKYRYFYHSYNRTWMNERAVEVGVIWDLLQQYPPHEVLEVGNVLSHYFPVRHDVLDKYEIAPGVINEDAVDFKPDKTYRLIVSISTFEHIGWDETPKDSTKVVRAVENLRKALAKGGTLISTMPIGYNPPLDKLMKEERLRFTKRHCLKRISADNTWCEAECSEVFQQSFGHPFPSANGLVIGIIEN